MIGRVHIVLHEEKQSGGDTWEGGWVAFKDGSKARARGDSSFGEVNPDVRQEVGSSKDSCCEDK